MTKNVLEYLEESVRRFPERCAYRDSSAMLTFSEVSRMARSAGSGLAALGRPGRPVAVMMEKSAVMAAALLGVVYGGMCYCPIDVAAPRERMRTIFSVLRPAAVVAADGYRKLAEELAGECATGDPKVEAGECATGDPKVEAGECTSNSPETVLETRAADGPETGAKTCLVFSFSELTETPEDPETLAAIRERSQDTDLLYILFTSGSTGVPKGVAGNHRMVINNMEWLATRYDLGPEDVLGSQVPFHFVVANHDLYCPLRFGCGTALIPPSYFTFPSMLIDFMNEHRVSAVFWVPFALSMAADLRAFSEKRPEFLRYVFFVGEVMPVRVLNYWRKHVGNAKYINLYGSTETHMCTFYEVDREFAEDETLPVGQPCANIDVLILDPENGAKNDPSGPGELCIRGAAVGPGYYNDPQRTAERFILNPLDPESGETVYRTGDLAGYNDRGELIYFGRMDYQIKHLGYRVELGEIEAAAGAVAGIRACACIYDEKKKLILFFYEGEELPRRAIAEALGERLPKYMMPNRYRHLEDLPRNANGKIDRKRLASMFT